MTAPKRLVQSSVFVLTAVGFGIPALVLAGSCIWLATLGYPIFLLGAAALLAIGGRGIYLAARGGVLIGCQRIEVRGWFTTKRIPGPSVHSIVVRPDRGRTGRLARIHRRESDETTGRNCETSAQSVLQRAVFILHGRSL